MSPSQTTVVALLLAFGLLLPAGVAHGHDDPVEDAWVEGSGVIPGTDIAWERHLVKDDKDKSKDDKDKSKNKTKDSESDSSGNETTGGSGGNGTTGGPGSIGGAGPREAAHETRPTTPPEQPGEPEEPAGSLGGFNPGAVEVLPDVLYCDADAYILAPWKWMKPVNLIVTEYPDAFILAGQAWEDAAGADIFGFVLYDLAVDAGVRDNVNAVSFEPLPDGTIAVTTTWYNTVTGEALESDARYNSNILWSNTGAPLTMDIQSIATHELGHTFGLKHPEENASNACLTMYATADAGEIHKRTLAPGDIAGIEALYG